MGVKFKLFRKDNIVRVEFLEFPEALRGNFYFQSNGYFFQSIDWTHLLSHCLYLPGTKIDGDNTRFNVVNLPSSERAIILVDKIRKTCLQISKSYEDQN